jgi:hypothetical protein
VPLFLVTAVDTLNGVPPCALAPAFRSLAHSRLVLRRLPRATATIGMPSSRVPPLIRFSAACAPVFSTPGFAGRVASVRRNARPKPKSSLQTAVGIKHSRVVQTTKGLMGCSFNAREFLHGRSTVFLSLGTFVIPALLLAATSAGIPNATIVAAVVQYLGSLAERRCFLAQSNHPQKPNYQTIA